MVLRILAPFICAVALALNILAGSSGALIFFFSMTFMLLVIGELLMQMQRAAQLMSNERQSQRDAQKKEREVIVARQLVTKKVLPCSNKQLQKPNSNESAKLILEVGCESAPSNGISRGSEDHRMCAICLESFKIHDDVSWSRYDECHHVYHHHCIMSWLAAH